jgi:Replication initiator protein A
MKPNDNPTEPDSEPIAQSVVSLGKDEMNLAEFPMALLTDRAPADQKTLKFEDRIFDERKGQFVTRKVVITAADEYRLPTAKDDEVMLGLLQLTKEANNFTERTVNFTRLDLIRLLGWDDTGQSYARIKESFKRWAGVFLYYENSWWDKQQQAWTTKGFHVIESFEINDSRPSKKQLEFAYSQFTWNEVIFRSFQAGYLKRLDLDVYLKLKHPTAKRMYRFLDKRFHHRRRLEFNLKEFAFEHIGLSRSYTDSGKLKEKLQPAIDELTEAGFLEPMSREDRYTKTGPGEWKLVVALKTARGEKKSKKAEASDLEAELTARGVTPTTALDLIEHYPAEHIRARLEAFDWLSSKKDKKVSKNPPGYLVKSIQDGYVDPKGFESEADRAKRTQAETVQRQKAEESKRRREAEETARLEAEEGAIRSYWESLSPAQQESLKAEALTETNSFFFKKYRETEGKDPSAAARYLKLIIDGHIGAILKKPSAANTE